MTGAVTKRSLCALLWSIASLSALVFPRWAVANGSDLPPEIVLQGFVKPEAGRVQVLVRVPLALLSSLSLPKRGPGYLDLASIDPKLKQAAAAMGRLVQVRADGSTLAPTVRELRLSLLSDRSFATYATALTHLQAPPLPVSTDLFWNQGFFDAWFELPLQSPNSNLAIRLDVPPEVGQRIKLQFEYLALDAPARMFEISGASGWIPLNPSWYQAAWLFAKTGFIDAFTFDRFVFLLCLIAPFQRLRSLSIVLIVLIVLQALTLTATAQGIFADAEIGWLPSLFDTVLGASTLLLAIANLGAPNLRRRWLIGGVVFALGGFALGRLLTDAWQFAGPHTLAAVVAFNVGVALGEIVVLVIAFFALRLFFARVLGSLLGVIVLSVLIGHVSWHWMMDGSRDLVRQVLYLPTTTLWSAWASLAPWLAPALVIGVAACFLPKRFAGAPAPTLLRALQRRTAEDDSGHVQVG